MPNQTPLQVQLNWLLLHIRKLARHDNLAAVIIHLNDTYRVEDRPPDVPGLARIVHVIKRIRRAAATTSDYDRTLVLHSGDFLSPCLISNTLKYYGEQMIELLKACGVDYITIGNHEFDFTRDLLIRRLTESGFTTVLTNLTPPPGYPKFERLVRWPEVDPFLTIAGFAGQQTIDEAVKPEFGFSVTAWGDELQSVMSEIEGSPRIAAFVALTHMDRDEDKDMQKALKQYWHKNSFAYILGGHDHDIHWQERKGNSILVKNYSNCRSISVVVLTKTNLATPRETWVPKPEYGSPDEELEIMQHHRGGMKPTQLPGIKKNHSARD